MPFSLVPDRVLDRFDSVTPELLADSDIQLVLCDLDYTLAPRSVSVPDEFVFQWLDRCKEAGVTVAILSNNRSNRRVELFCSHLGISYVGHAGKPSRKGFRRAMEKYGVAPEHTAMLGDKLLTDVLGANRSGVMSWMVEPLGGPVGAWNHVLHFLQRPFKAISKRRLARTQF